MKRLGLMGIIAALVLALPAFAQQQQQLTVEDFRQPLEQLREAVNEIIDQLLQQHEMNDEEMSVDRDQLEELQEEFTTIVDALLENEQPDRQTIRESLERLQEVLNDIIDAVLEDLEAEPAM